MSQKLANQAKKFLAEEARNYFPDKLTARKDGTLVARKSYFYRHGMTAERWADQTAEALKTGGYNVAKVTASDDWAEWPKTSYFTAVVTFGE